MPDDLTFTQLKNTVGGLGQADLVVLDSNYGPIIRVKALLADIPTNTLDSRGVVEFIYKLIEKCSVAQNMANEGAATGNKLAAFPAANYGTPKEDADGIMRVQATQQVVSRLAVSEDVVVGPRV